jgi:hypothetical protein
MWYINQPKILWREFFIIRKLTCPIYIQWWVGLYKYDLGFHWSRLLILKPQQKGIGKRVFCKGGYNLEKSNLIVTPLQIQGA